MNIFKTEYKGRPVVNGYYEGEPIYKVTFQYMYERSQMKWIENTTWLNGTGDKFKRTNKPIKDSKEGIKSVLSSKPNLEGLVTANETRLLRVEEI